MLRDYELRFSVGAIACFLMDIGTDLEAGEHRYYQHCHPGFELHYITKGYFEISSEKKKMRVCAGQLLIIPPGVYHYVVAVSEDACRMTMSVEMRYSGESGNHTRDAQFYQCFPWEHVVCLPVANTPTEEDFERIRTLARSFDRSYLSVEKLRALCTLLIVNLFELLSADAKIDMVAETPARSVQEFAIDTFLGNHFMCNNSNGELARKLNVSQRQLHRIIKKAYGMNYREKLKQIRIEIATDFLSNTDKSIEKIAELLGYSNSANFSAFVKRETGKTPSAIRAEGRKGNNQH